MLSWDLGMGPDHAHQGPVVVAQANRAPDVPRDFRFRGELDSAGALTKPKRLSELARVSGEVLGRSTFDSWRRSGSCPDGTADYECAHDATLPTVITCGKRSHLHVWRACLLFLRRKAQLVHRFALCA